MTNICYVLRLDQQRWDAGGKLCVFGCTKERYCELNNTSWWDLQHNYIDTNTFISSAYQCDSSLNDLQGHLYLGYLNSLKKVYVRVLAENT